MSDLFEAASPQVDRAMRLVGLAPDPTTGRYPCPVCPPGADPTVDLNGEGSRWRCRRCGTRGDAIDIIARHSRGAAGARIPPSMAARLILGEVRAPRHLKPAHTGADPGTAPRRPAGDPDARRKARQRVQRARTMVREALGALGLEPDEQGRWPCPACAAPGSPLTVNRAGDRWHCGACGRGGDALNILVDHARVGIPPGPVSTGLATTILLDGARPVGLVPRSATGEAAVPDGIPVPEPVDGETLGEVRTRVREALVMLGSTPKGRYWVCPACRPERATLAVFPDGWKCHRCGEHGNAIDLLVDHGRLAGGAPVEFPTAVALLSGRLDPARVGLVPVEGDLGALEVHRSTDDPQVLEDLISNADPRAARAVYGADGIDPRAVGALRFTMVTDPDAWWGRAVATWGVDRLVDAGLTTEDGRPLVACGYPIIEPHLDPAGRPRYLQFRAHGRTRDRHDAHKRWRATMSELEAALVAASADERPAVMERIRAHQQNKAPWVPKFLSLRGASPDRHWGFGAPAVAAAEPGSVVLIVEGGKDTAAAMTAVRRGLVDTGPSTVVYGIPGAATTPHPGVLEIIADRRLRPVIALDGDDAGQDGTRRLVEWFATQGVEAGVRSLPPGLDWAGLLATR